MQIFASVAQLVEHLICNQAVIGSTPVRGFQMSKQVVLLTMLVSFGSVSEGLKETGCKPVGSAYVGSNPTAPIFLLQTTCAGVAQLVEHRPSKPRVASSNLVSRFVV